MNYFTAARLWFTERLWHLQLYRALLLDRWHCLPVVRRVQLLALVLMAAFSWLLTLAMTLILASALALSGCGTAPSQAPTRLPVPAELLIPPKKPVLLTPALGLKPPGPTTPSTPKAVP